MSVAAQDLLQDAMVETIVVDDGSGDGTHEWLASQNMPNLRIITQNGIGPARARNLAIEAARGKLIAFLDADDFWWPGKLRAQIAAHEARPDAALSFSDYLHLDPDGLCMERASSSGLSRRKKAIMRWRIARRLCLAPI